MDSLTNLIYEYGMAAMFIIILLEYACFPVSSEIVLPLSGAIASLQHIPFYVILPASVLAGIIGTGFCYLIGRIGGNSILEYIMRKFPKTRNGILISTSKFKQYGSFAVCFGRIIPICRTYIAFIAGAAGQKPVKFFSFSLFGIAIWNTVLIGIGYFLRENWDKAGMYYEQYKMFLIPLLIVLFILLFLKIKAAKQKG